MLKITMELIFKQLIIKFNILNEKLLGNLQSHLLDSKMGAGKYYLRVDGDAELLEVTGN